MTKRVTLDEVPRPGAIPAFDVPGWALEFGVVAGVTGRGTQPGGFDLGLGSGQPVGEVLGRWGEVQAAFPEFRGIVVARQVHGTNVLWHDRNYGWAVFPGADGHATASKGVLLTVSLADCIPIYMIDPVRGALGLLHSGWRGTASGMLAAGIELLRRQVGTDPADLAVHIGVGICGTCYQVSAEVATVCGRPPTGGGGGASQLDLRAVLADRASEQGIGRVSVSSLCSAHSGRRFFSHRGSAGRDGRMVAFLGFPSLE